MMARRDITRAAGTPEIVICGDIWVLAHGAYNDGPNRNLSVTLTEVSWGLPKWELNSSSVDWSECILKCLWAVQFIHGQSIPSFLHKYYQMCSVTSGCLMRPRVLLVWLCNPCFNWTKHFVTCVLGVWCRHCVEYVMCGRYCKEHAVSGLGNEWWSRQHYMGELHADWEVL